RWLVTSWCAASGSWCSCQRLASMNSSSLASIGNLRISARYRLRPPSGDITASALAAAMVYPLTLLVGRPDRRACSARAPPAAPSTPLDRYGTALSVGSGAAGRWEDGPKIRLTHSGFYAPREAPSRR